ncbi:MAG: hypothetical protein HY673_03910 [Chloroflexi bacterium]|nr:hypothetical protein [Chloroflexota bacterium]
MEPVNPRAYLAVLVIWLAIFGLASFAFAIRSSSDVVTLSVMPQVPRKGEPIAITFNLNNPGLRTLPVAYDFYINGKKVKSGAATLSAASSRKFSYTYVSDVELGDQANFAIRASSPDASYEKYVSIPAYAPQVWSSFVSFASFSTSVMGSMGSMIYYQDSFTASRGTQVGVVFALVLLALLAFRDVTRHFRAGGGATAVVALRLKFATLAAILLIIVLAMIFTKIVLIMT